MDWTKGFANKLFDEYSFPARTIPAVIFTLFLITVGWAFAGFWNFLLKEIVVFVGLFSLCVLVVGYFLSNFIASIGRRKQDGIFKKWGGTPSTICLRHDNEYIDKHTLSRYHKKLTVLVGLSLPDKQAQKRNGKGADEKYESCVNYLRNATRDSSKFPLVLRQNADFGFWRNLWGVKYISLGILVVSVVLYFGILFFAYEDGFVKFRLNMIVFICVSVSWLLFWMFLVNMNFVRDSGFRYAKALLESIETLEDD